ncbi:MAG TPA: hypothetical protein VHQ90_15930 [Thermoanaerobaculia bacterium]|nr:hypothetical protein [Thermoanaerobaculia bacterium]
MRADANTALAAYPHALYSVLKACDYTAIPNPKRGKNVLLNDLAVVQLQVIPDLNG